MDITYLISNIWYTHKYFIYSPILLIDHICIIDSLLIAYFLLPIVHWLSTSTACLLPIACHLHCTEHGWCCSASASEDSFRAGHSLPINLAPRGASAECCCTVGAGAARRGAWGRPERDGHPAATADCRRLGARGGWRAGNYTGTGIHEIITQSPNRLYKAPLGWTEPQDTIHSPHKQHKGRTDNTKPRRSNRNPTSCNMLDKKNIFNLNMDLFHTNTGPLTLETTDPQA